MNAVSEIHLHSSKMRMAAMKAYLKKDFDSTILHLLETPGAFVRYAAVSCNQPSLLSLKAVQNLNHDILSFKNLKEDQDRLNKIFRQISDMPPEWTVLQITSAFARNPFLPAMSPGHLTKFFVLRIPCGPQFRKESILHYCFSTSKENLLKILDEYLYLHTMKTSSNHETYYCRVNASLNCKEYMKYVGSIFEERESWLQGRLCDSILEGKIRKRIDCIIEQYRPNIGFGKRCEAYLMAEACTVIPGKVIMEGLLQLCNSTLLARALFNEIKKIKSNLGPQLEIAKRHPIILITDEITDNIPWESIPILQNHPVTRMPSIHFLYAQWIFHKPHIRNGLREIDAKKNGLYVIDPEAKCPCLQKVNYFFKKRFPMWKGVYQVAPDVPTFISTLSSANLYFYCGHGSGDFLLDNINTQELVCNSVPLLFGCCSVAHKKEGGSLCHSYYAWEYNFAGSSCTMGMLFKVMTGDTECMTAMVANSSFPGQQICLETLNKINGSHEPELLRVLHLARKTCKHFINGAAFVARGIPVKIV